MKKCEPPSLLTLHQALRQAGLKRSDYYNKRKRNAFPKPVITGLRQIRFLQSEVTAWIEQLVIDRDSPRKDLL